jgi:hypothetical protein
MSVDQSTEPPAELSDEELEKALNPDDDGPEYKRGDVGFHNPKDLLADKEHSTAGAGIIDAANQLDKAVKEGNKVGIGLGSVGVALEGLGLVLDPIGSVLAAGIGWLIEHVTPLRWPLDVLHGDPFGISAAADAIGVEKNAMDVMATQHQAKLATLMSSWQGPAADEFKKHMDAVTEGLGALGNAIDFAGKQMKIAGGIIGAFRGIIRDMIAMFLAMLIKGALIALALAPISFGASIAAYITTAIGGVAALLAKVSTQLSKLTSTMTKSLTNMGNVSKATDNFNSTVGNATKTGGKTGGKPTPAPAGGAGKPIPKPPSGGAPPPKPQGADPAPSPVAPPPKVDPVPPPVKPQGADPAPPPVAPPPKVDPVPPPVKPQGADPAPPPVAPPPKPAGGAPGPVKPQGADPAPPAVTPPPKPAAGGAPPAKPQGADPAPPAVTPPPKPAGGAPPAKPAPAAPGGKWSDNLKNHKFPMLDKAVQKATRDALESALKKFPPSGRPPLTQSEINAVLNKFDDAGKFPKSYVEKIFGESGTRAIEGTLRTMNDPLYGGRGAVGKAINEVTKGTGPNGDESEK